MFDKTWHWSNPNPVTKLFAGPSYSEPSLQRQHLFPKMLPLKWICCCKESLMQRMISKKGLVILLFPQRTYVLDFLLELPHEGDSNKNPKHKTYGSWSIKYNVLTWYLINCHLFELKKIHAIQIIIVTNFVLVSSVDLFVLRFYGPVNPMGSCRAWSVYLTTLLLGRFSPLSG